MRLNRRGDLHNHGVRSGVEIKLWTKNGTLTKLVVTLRHRHKLIARVRIARLTTRKRVLILRHNGHMPRRGRYALKVTQGRKTLLVDFDPQPLSPQIQALKAILERLEPQKPQPIPDTASTG